jgi:tryptophan synthase alpha chain
MIEIGIPFSDPMADGVVIQNAATQALRNGMTLRKLFDQLKEIRQEVSIPLILMGYLNPIMQYGFENFCKSCQSCGIDGVIIPDLPFKDYVEEFLTKLKKIMLRGYCLQIILLMTLNLPQGLDMSIVKTLNMKME